MPVGLPDRASVTKDFHFKSPSGLEQFLDTQLGCEPLIDRQALFLLYLQQRAK